MTLERLGSGTTSPQQAAAVLRARAARFGLPVRPVEQVDPVDLVAAAVAADAWLVVTGAESLERAGSRGRAAAALAAALARAAGHADPAVEQFPEPTECSSAPAHVGAADGYAEWAAGMLGDAGTRALRRAAADLSAGGDARLLAFAELLLALADPSAD